MLKITPSQMEALSKTQLDGFIDRVLARSRKFFPKTRAMSDDDVHNLIRHGIERAGAYAIFSERDVAKYVGLMLLWGKEFDSAHPNSWVVSVLRNSILAPDYKLNLLYDHAVLGGGPS